MINIHLNGDIVRCPDIAAIQVRAQIVRDAHRICKYNYHEGTCEVWNHSVEHFMAVKKNNTCGRCTLFCSEQCPGHNARVQTGNEKKTFKIDNTVYRKLASSSHYLNKTSLSKNLFITLTFPPFKRKVSDNELNNYFSRYVENLRSNYDCGGYIGARERGKKRNRVHFHLLLSIPFVDFRTLNDSWCNCIKDICAYSKNALQTDPKTKFITNPIRAMKYVCKYFAKCKNQKSESRLVFISNNIILRPVQYQGTIESLLFGYKGIYIQQTSDYSTSFRITEKNDFERFCNDFLYEAYNIKEVISGSLYAFPIDSS